MKLKLTFWLLTVSLTCIAETITVGSGQRIEDAANRAKAGDVIQLVANNTLSSTAFIKAGVQVIGVNNPTITVTGGNGFEAKSAAIEAGQNVFKGFRLVAASRGSPYGIRVVNRNNVTIDQIYIEGFGEEGVSIGTEVRGGVLYDIRITNFHVKNSAYEASDKSLGNITLRGNIKNLLIENGTIEHTAQKSGYAIKALAYWVGNDKYFSLLTNGKINNVKQIGKPTGSWAGGLASNIGFEFWGADGQNFEISNCDLTNGISLEYNHPQKQGRSFWIHHNKIKVPYAGIGEFATSGILFENNYVDFRENTNPWGVFFEANNGANSGPGPISNVVIRNNTFDLGDKSPSFFAYTWKVDGLIFENNTILQTDKSNPLIFELRRSFSNGGKNLVARNNKIKKYREIDFVADPGYNGPPADKNTFSAISFSNNTNTATGAVVQPNPTIPQEKPPVVDASDGKFFTGYNLNGNSIVVDGNLWSNRDFTTNGIWFKWNTTPSPTPVNDEYKAMLQSSIYGNPLRVTLNNIPNGTYMVYIYANEDNAPGAANIDVQGVRMLTGFRFTKAGEWKRLGPYNANVTDGKINIVGSGSDVNFSAITLYQAVDTPTESNEYWYKLPDGGYTKAYKTIPK